MQCEVQIPPVPDLKDGEITVGRDLYLHCTGSWPSTFDLEKISVKNELPPYSFKIFKAERQDLTSVDIKFTSYTPGDQRFTGLVVTDGDEDVTIDPFQFNVASVLNSAEPQKEPFPPLGPMNAPIPQVIWFALILLIAGLVTAAVLIWRRQRQRKLWRSERKKYAVRISPVMQMYVELRRLDRKSKELPPETHIARLLQIFDEYLIRRFDWPVPFLRRKKISRMLRREFRGQEALAQQISELHRTLYNFQKQKQKLTDKNFFDIQKDLETLIERMEKEKRNELA